MLIADPKPSRAGIDRLEEHREGGVILALEDGLKRHGRGNGRIGVPDAV
jgi:hypothetical protein